MDDLIYDAYSIFYQILQLVAPDYLGEPEFLLLTYTFSGLFILLVLYVIFRIVYESARVIISWFSRG